MEKKTVLVTLPVTEEQKEYLEETAGERAAFLWKSAAAVRDGELEQADAIIAAREKIVEGAVGMVKIALEKLSAEEVVDLDDEKKAAMVSNLMVVLCGDDTAQPIVNAGTLNM